MTDAWSLDVDTAPWVPGERRHFPEHLLEVKAPASRRSLVEHDIRPKLIIDVRGFVKRDRAGAGVSLDGMTTFFAFTPHSPCWLPVVYDAARWDCPGCFVAKSTCDHSWWLYR